MVVGNSVTEEEVDWDTMSGEASGESWKALVIKDSPNNAAQILEDRYTQLKAQLSSRCSVLRVGTCQLHQSQY